MKTPQLFLIISLIVCNNCLGQIVKTVIGPDAGNLGGCLLVLKNGNVIFSSQDRKTSIYKLEVFNSDLIKINEKELNYKTPSLDKAYSKSKQTAYMQKIYEIGDKIVIFEMDNKIDGKKECGLYRIIMNSTNLEIEKEELILKVNRAGSAVSSPYKDEYGLDSPFFYITKDENSDYYAIIKYGYQKRDDAESHFEVHHYSPEHKEISNAKFDYLNNQYNYARPLNFTVYADKYVILISSVFNSEHRLTMDTKIVLSKLEKGKTEFIHIELDFTKNFDSDYCAMKKNEKHNTLEVLVYNKEGANMTKRVYSLIFQSLDPEKMVLNKMYVMPRNKLNNFAVNNCNINKGYGNGMISDYYINNNGNIVATSVKNVFSLAQGYALSGDPELIGFCEFDNSGNDINAWTYPHFSDCINTTFSNEKGIFSLINEIAENMETPLSSKFKSTYEKEINAVLLTLKDNGEIQRQYVFGKPEKKKNIFINRGYFDKRSKTYIAWLSSGKDDKNEKIALIKFQ